MFDDDFIRSSLVASCGVGSCPPVDSDHDHSSETRLIDGS